MALSLCIRKGFWLSCRGVAAAGLLALAAGTAVAQEQPDPARDPERVRAEYENLSRDIELSSDRLGKLAAEIALVKKDNATITATLIQSAKTERKLGQDVEEIAGKLDQYREQETVLRQSLAARSDVLAEVLGALQRMGLNPPPAILVSPDDALSSVRSAILLGAVVPELREETETLMVDLKELSRVRASIEAERTRLVAALGEQAAEKERLNLLLEAKSRVQDQTETALALEKKRSSELASKATSMKDLIAALEKEADRRRVAAEAQARRDAELASMPVPESNRLAETLPFAQLRRQVALPVSGQVKRRFGGNDGNGGVMLGDMVATQSTAIVTAPVDGDILYAGPFRSYGQLLILNAGDGYHIVLAGMSRISVAPGQTVLAGEPIGVMGDTRVASALASETTNLTPELYIEFRKDGKPVDPAPWWADRFSGRT